MVYMKKIKTKIKLILYDSLLLVMRHISSQNIILEKVIRLEMSSVTLLSSKGALQEGLLILL